MASSTKRKRRKTTFRKDYRNSLRRNSWNNCQCENCKYSTFGVIY